MNSAAALAKEKVSTGNRPVATRSISAAALAKENPLEQLARNGPVTFHSRMGREQFHRFLLRNADFKIERDKHGYVTIYPLMTYDSSINEGEAFFALKLWAKQNPKLGKVLSPSASFDLPDGSTHKADGAWVSMK